MKYSALQFTEDFMIPYSTDFQKQIPVCKDLNEDEKVRIKTLFDQIYKESVSNLVNSTAIIQSEIHTLLLELERIAINNSETSIMSEIMERYKSLIDSSFAKERQVQYYAGQLEVSANYLNVLTKKHFNKPALEMINERLILEIKRLLLRTDNDISEIAYKLGFNELSYFSRFFKCHTGSTPHEFRNMMNKMYQK
ncbi:helix-turn-helix domain-containing protein [uncultured Bacteroides sp.]|uniref:helix-turn-helix domain-containing protein n=1 Tax=uncultured Bacteroides sp. TaxID=162156 RepID=UPI0025E2B08D|nr:helix-turn-helix domain-containing protein [uncultured Bacteroides sp.]